MQIARYSSERDNAPETLEVSWADLVELLTTHKRTDCNPCIGGDCSHKFGDAWSAVDMSPCPEQCHNHGRKTAKDCGGGQFHRLNLNVRALNVAVFDIDHVTTEQLEGIAARVDAAGLAAILHSSHSHAPPNDCRVRLVMPMSRPASPSEWPKLRRIVDEWLKLAADTKTKDLARLYFLPSAPSHGFEPLALSTDGKPLNVDALLAQASSTSAPARVAAPTPEPDDAPVNFDRLRERLRSLRRSYRVSKREGDEQRADILDRILKGEKLADVGGRDDTLNVAVSILATSLPANTPDEAIVELIRDSVVQMDPPEQGDWLGHAAYKLERARERRHENDARRDAARARQWAGLRSEGAKLEDDEPEPEPEPEQEQTSEDAEVENLVAEEDETESDDRYPETKLLLWLVEQRVINEDEIDLPTEDLLKRFERRWIIQKKDGFWVFGPGRYLPPIARVDLDVSLPRDLSRAPIPIELPDRDGNVTPLSTKALLGRYATVARDVQASLSLQRSYYDPRTQTFHEAIRPLRRIKSRQHPEIDFWLRLLGGSEAERLLDWVATVTRLDRQACAIYLKGKPGIGKGLLASGLARLWSVGGPSELRYVLEGFNDVLVNCPLLFADESLPAKRGITAELRRIIGSSARNLNRKFLPICNLTGAVRLIIAANNANLLNTGEELSADDLAAVAQRFLFIDATTDAINYLEAIGGTPVVERWVTEDKLAEHALWLRDTRTIDETSRFLVQGEAREFHEQLATGSGFSSMVCEWLVRYLVDPTTKNSNKNLILVGEGELYVNAEALSGKSAWESRAPSTNVPSATKIGRALSNLSTESKRISIGGVQRIYHRVKAKTLIGWAERSQIGDPEYLRARIEAPNEIIAKAKAIG